MKISFLLSAIGVTLFPLSLSAEEVSTQDARNFVRGMYVSGEIYTSKQNLIKDMKCEEIIGTPKPSISMTEAELFQIIPDSPDSTEKNERAMAREFVKISNDRDALYKPAEDLLRSYTSIGIAGVKRGPELQITAVLPGSGAEKAKLRVGDKVVSVDGMDLSSMNLAQAFQIMSPPEPQKMRFSIIRGKNSQVIDVTSQFVQFRPAYEIRKEDGVLILIISNFWDDTLEEIPTLLEQQIKGAKGIVIDIRGNAGGKFSTMENLLSMFLPKNSAYVEVIVDHKSCLQFTKKDPVISPSFPLAIIIDSGTMAGAELFAAKLRENKRAMLIGKKTLGFDRLDEQITFESRATLQFNLATLRSPNSKRFGNGIGVKPDLIVAKGNKQTDLQLRKAIEVIKKSSLWTRQSK